MSIGTVEFDLSMVNPDNGEFLTARGYTVEGVLGVDGQPRLLSMGQLVMAICLQRASQLENGYTDPATNEHVNGIIDLMEEMNATSALLEGLTQIEKDIVETTSGSINLKNRYLTYDGRQISYWDFLSDEHLGDLSNVPEQASASSSNLINDIETKMDENNSFSQQKMIELQSQTSKRDQTYDMISNILKSFNTVLTGIVNNT